jgi:hypothetical protein
MTPHHLVSLVLYLDNFRKITGKNPEIVDDPRTTTLQFTVRGRRRSRHATGGVLPVLMGRWGENTGGRLQTLLVTRDLFPRLEGAALQFKHGCLESVLRKQCPVPVHKLTTLVMQSM